MKITAATTTLFFVSTTLQSASGFQTQSSSRSRCESPHKKSSSVPFATIDASNEEGKPGSPFRPPPNSSGGTTTTASPPPAAASSSAFEDLKLPDLPTSLQDIQIPEMLKNVDMKSILDSFQDGGEFGSRGEVYVAGQFILILAVAFGGGIPFLSEFLALGGPVVLLSGLGGIALSVSNLGRSLSPFITPNSNNDNVVTSGMYQYVRHPMYTSLIMTCVGWSLVTDSASRLVMTALLVALMQVKTTQEEKRMVEQFPQAYPAYQSKVSGKFFPVEFFEETKGKFLKK